MKKLPSSKPLFSNEDLTKIVKSSPLGLVVSRLDGSFEYVNPALIKMLGYSEDEIYDPKILISHPDDIANSRNIRQELMSNPNQPITIEKRYLHKNGDILCASLSIVALTDDQGNIERFVGQVINIANQKQAETSAQLFRAMIDSSHEAMFIIDVKTGKILDANTHGYNSLGYTYEEVLELAIFDIDQTIHSSQEWNYIIDIVRKDKNTLFDGIHIKKNKQAFNAETSINYVILNETEYILAISRNITERKKMELLIWEQANYDMLTKLPNRNMLYEKLQQAIKNAERFNKKVATLCLDLDKFKEVHDTLGHDIGDKLLIIAGNRIKQCIRDIDTISRLGGDEFCIIIEYVEETSHVNRVCSSIRETLSKPFYIDDNKIFISTSIGVSFFPDDAKNVDDLLKHSDQAMYFSKNKGRNCFQYFTESMQKEATHKMRLSQDLRNALKQQQLYIEYQAITSFLDHSVKKVEALLRWQHPQLGNIPPSEFIPIAEENGMIDKIGNWVFAEVINVIKIWRKKYNSELQVSINASPLYFREGNEQISLWQQQMHKLNIPTQAIVVEITEGLLMETSDKVASKLLELRDAGIQVALDDFGTGYSSLAYLKKLDIDYLKIDKSFVENLTSNSNEEALCEAIIVMAHKLKLQVIAEGIETQQQYQLLRSFNCDYGQGFFFSKPINKDQFDIFLSQQS